jgi:glycine/D-amino acid oxidase-like deaminating enzyme
MAPNDSHTRPANRPHDQQLLPVPNPVPSYWLSPPSPLATLRSTPCLPASTPIAILGSGLAGILTLYHVLASAPHSSAPHSRALLLDARALCSGATGRNGGHAKIKTATLAGLRAGERGAWMAYVGGVRAELARIVEAEDMVRECEFEARRSYDVFLDGAELAGVKGVYDDAVSRRESWVVDIRFVGAEGAERETGVKGAVGAFNVPVASFWPYKFATGLLARLLDRYPGQVNVQMNTTVLRVREDGVLETSRGNVEAGKVVFATNAWTAGVLEGFEGVITPVRGMACHIAAANPGRERDLHETYNIHFAPNAAGPTGTDYLNSRPDGSIVVGGGSWFFRHRRELWYNNRDDSVRFPSDVEKHWDAYMQATFAGWENSGATTDSVWTGIMGFTPDGKPHVGRVPGRERQWMLAGFNGGGMGLIPTAAKAVAAMVVRDQGFGDVKEEFGLLEGFATSLERLEMKY